VSECFRRILIFPLPNPWTGPLFFVSAKERCYFSFFCICADSFVLFSLSEYPCLRLINAVFQTRAEVELCSSSHPVCQFDLIHLPALFLKPRTNLRRKQPCKMSSLFFRAERTLQGHFAYRPSSPPLLLPKSFSCSDRWRLPCVSFCIKMISPVSQ